MSATPRAAVPSAAASSPFASPPSALWADADAAFLIGECGQDQAKGLAGPILSKAELDAQFGQDQWLPMPRFLHVQPNGS